MSVAWLAAVDAALLLLLSGLHVYWACGGAWGKAVGVPSRPAPAGSAGALVFQPSPRATLLVAILLIAAATVVLTRSGWLPALPLALSSLGTWTVAALFLLRAVGDLRYVGLFKSVRATRFARWDTALFTPLCGLIGGLTARVGWLGD